MIDPRNLPYARVCLSRLSTRELPPNALQQYHKYATKRKRSDPALTEARELNRRTISVQQPAARYSFGATDHLDTAGNRSTAAQDIFLTRVSSQKFPFNSSHVSEDSLHVTSGLLKNATETGEELYPKAYSAGKLFQPPDAQHLLKIKGDVKTGNVQPCRRNSVKSTTSSDSSKGRELSASVHLSPVTWSDPTVTKRTYVNYKPKTLGESSDEAVSDVTDHCESLVTGNILEPQGLLYKQVPSDSSTSSLEERSEASVVSDESTVSASLSSLKGHSSYGCEDVWPDFNSYSPPESPDPQNTESGTEIFSMEPDIVLPMEAKIRVPLKVGILDKMEMEESSSVSVQSEVPIRHPSAENNGLLSPKINLVPLDIKDNRGVKRKFSFSSATPSKRKSLSPNGDLVIKLNDIGDKLKASPSGGFTVADSKRAGRYTSSGRRILASYSEKSLAKSVMKRTPMIEVKKHKAKKTAKCLLHKNHKCTCCVESQKDKPKKRKNKPRKRDITLLHYESLSFKELNTIPRISTRYKVAFSKWPYVFSGALDLINQRISNQNSFWNSIRS